MRGRRDEDARGQVAAWLERADLEPAARTAAARPRRPSAARRARSRRRAARPPSRRGRAPRCPMRRMSRTCGSSSATCRGLRARARAPRTRSRSRRAPSRGRRASRPRAARRRAVAGRPSTTRKHSPRERVEDHADARRALAGDRDAPLRDAEQVVDGAVERIDDPAHARCRRRVSSPSSPRIASSGRSASSTSRIARSAATSASLTRSVGELFVATAPGPRRPRVLEQHGGGGPRGALGDVEQLRVVHGADPRWCIDAGSQGSLRVP